MKRMLAIDGARGSRGVQPAARPRRGAGEGRRAPGGFRARRGRGARGLGDGDPDRGGDAARPAHHDRGRRVAPGRRGRVRARRAARGRGRATPRSRARSRPRRCGCCAAPGDVVAAGQPLAELAEPRARASARGDYREARRARAARARRRSRASAGSPRSGSRRGARCRRRRPSCAPPRRRSPRRAPTLESLGVVRRPARAARFALRAPIAGTVLERERRARPGRRAGARALPHRRPARRSGSSRTPPSATRVRVPAGRAARVTLPRASRPVVHRRA